MTNPAAVAALRAQIASKIRAIHHYGTPPDARLVEDVESDVRDILEDVQALLDGAALEAPPSLTDAEAVDLWEQLRDSDTRGFATVSELADWVRAVVGRNGEAPPEPPEYRRGEPYDHDFVQPVSTAPDASICSFCGHTQIEHQKPWVRGVVPAPPPEGWLNVSALTDEQLDALRRAAQRFTHHRGFDNRDRIMAMRAELLEMVRAVPASQEGGSPRGEGNAP